MAKHTITLIPGDGIGPEIADAMRRIVDASGADIEWEIVDAGEAVMAEYGTPLPQHVLDSVRKNKIAIKGPITTPVGHGFRSVNVALRKELDLYVNLRPAVSYPGCGGRYDDVNLVIVRENTEDLYAGIEYEMGSPEAAQLAEFVNASGAGTIRPDAGISIKPISEFGSRRIVKWAFDYAIREGRSKVTAVHKANIMKHSDGLYLRVAREVAAEYGTGPMADDAAVAAARAAGIPELGFEDRIVDATCMGLVRNPADFDVVVLPNLYGDIVSDLCAGLVGGLGMAPGANIGDECAVFEAVHGSAPTHAGKNDANPTALILSAVLALRHIGEAEAANRVEDAVVKTLSEGTSVTYDVRRAQTGSTEGAVSTSAYADAVIANMA